MYNKIFTKILDSSIWLEPDATRIVWMTMIAAMDEDGICLFAAVDNLAHRARVSIEAATAAVKTLESPDKKSSDPANRGKRIERIEGGWVVLNSGKYRGIVSREVQRAQTKERMRRLRENRRKKRRMVTLSDATLRSRDALLRSVTPSEAEAEADTRADTDLGSANQNHPQNPTHAQIFARAREEEPTFRPPNGNPHGNPDNLVNGHALRKHGTHAWCSLPRDGLCVSPDLHREFIGKSLKTDAEMRVWYAATVERFAGVAIGEDPFIFWRNEFGTWCGIATTRPVPVKKKMTLQEMADARAASVRQ